MKGLGFGEVELEDVEEDRNAIMYTVNSLSQ